MKLESVPTGVRIRLGIGAARERYVVAVLDRHEAMRRAEILKTLAHDMCMADKEADALAILPRAAAAVPADVFASIVRIAQNVAGGKVRAATVKLDTFQMVGEMWSSGELARRFPDYVQEKKSAALDAGRLAALYEQIGKVPIATFTLEDGERAMKALPANLASATRRQYAQLIAKVLKLSVYPLKLIAHTPISTGFLPTVRNQKITAWLYPDEDRKLLSCREIPLECRVLYGFLCREGLRLSEALGLTWKDLDLVRGAVRLDANKTDDPRAWALTPGVPEALALWRSNGAESPFPNVRENKAAEHFREHLGLAGVDREEIFERSDVRRPIRVHDLRATFVTVSLANGKSEAWVSDRTGHKSSVMINRYRRQARQVSDLALGGMSPLNECLPEFSGQKSGQQNRTSNLKTEKSGTISTVSRDGIEPPTRGFSIPQEAKRRSKTAEKTPTAVHDDAGESRKVASAGQKFGHFSKKLANTLEAALAAAVAAGEWETVATLAKTIDQTRSRSDGEPLRSVV